MQPSRVIITAASESFGPALLSMLGSMNVNWPEHPRVIVYDIGLSADVLKTLADNEVEVRKVPPFCPHWRKHYTWKLWCWNDAPADHVLWLDAGMAILQPIEETFVAIEKVGYFVICNHHSLETEASVKACEGCKVPPEFRKNKPTFPANIFGFDKSGKPGEVIREALQVGMIEDYIRAYELPNRYEQAIVSLLWHKNFSPIAIHDRLIYAELRSPTEVAGQRIWNCHRQMHPEDREYYIAHIRKPGQPRIPRVEPRKRKPLSKRARGFLAARIKQVQNFVNPAPPAAPKPYDGIAESVPRL
jgi:hypothetical protein